MTEQTRTLILGIGNILMGDDGLGVRYVKAFSRLYEPAPGVEVLDGGTAGLQLLEYIQGFDSIIVVDAVLADSEPGTILRYGDENLKDLKQLTRPSAHQVGLFELIGTARFAGHSPTISLIGVVPESVVAGAPLSKKIEELTQSVAKEIAHELKLLGIECKARP